MILLTKSFTKWLLVKKHDDVIKILLVKFNLNYHSVMFKFIPSIDLSDQFFFLSSLPFPLSN